MGARDESNTVPAGRRPELILARPASVIFRSVSSSTGNRRLERSFGVAQQCCPPSQNAGSFVLGVEPPQTVTSSPIVEQHHPSGISPSSDSTRRSGKRS